MSVCKGCGREIVWATEDGSGLRIPLDTKPPIYEFVGSFQGGDNDNGQTVRLVKRNREAAVSHFATCPRANQFSGSKR